MITLPMRPVLSTSEAEPGLLIAYDPDAPYPYWACWEADQTSGGRLSEAPVGHGHTPQEAIDCLYALMAWWCLQQYTRLPLSGTIGDHTGQSISPDL